MGRDKGKRTEPVAMPPQTPPASYGNLRAMADAAAALVASELQLFSLSASPTNSSSVYPSEPLTWRALPEELKLRVLSFLDVPELCTLEVVCKETRRLARDDSLWHDLYLRRWRISKRGGFAAIPSDEHIHHFRFDWKGLYKKRYQLELSLWREENEDHQRQDDGNNSGDQEEYNPFPPFQLPSDPEEVFEWAQRLSNRARSMEIEAQRSRRRSYSVDSSSTECPDYETAISPSLQERRRRHQEEVERERIEELWALWYISYEEFVTSQLLRESPRTRVAVNGFLSMLHLYYMSCECCKDVEGIKSAKATDKLFTLLQTRLTQLMGQHPHWQDGYYAWGKLLSHQALRKRGQETFELCENAWTKFTQALEIVQNHIEREITKIEDSIHDPIHCSWGYTLLILGKRLLKEKDPQYIKYFNASRDQYMMATHRPKSDSCFVLRPYNLACLYSLLNDSEMCQKYLEECVGLKGIDQAKVLEDADFDNMKDQPWFHDIVARLPEEDGDTN